MGMYWTLHGVALGQSVVDRSRSGISFGWSGVDLRRSGVDLSLVLNHAGQLDDMRAHSVHWRVEKEIYKSRDLFQL